MSKGGGGWIQSTKSECCFFVFMKRILIPVLLVLFFSLNVSAQTYIINGRATYADNSQVQFQDVTIDCEIGENDCLKFTGTTTQTDRSGNFTLTFNVNEEDDGTPILLKVRGEEFPHTLNIALLENAGGSLTQNIKLSQNPTPPGSGFGSACCILLFVITAIYVVGKTARMLSTPAGRMEFRGYKPSRMVECPVCNIHVAQHQLVKHLIVDHDIEMFEAGEMAGKAMRAKWENEV